MVVRPRYSYSLLQEMQRAHMLYAGSFEMYDGTEILELRDTLVDRKDNWYSSCKDCGTWDDAVYKLLCITINDLDKYITKYNVNR